MSTLNFSVKLKPNVRYSIKVDKVLKYAMDFVGTPYIWGGNNPNSGFDCSGFIIEVMSSAGAEPPGDMSAKQLFEWYAKHGKPISKIRPQAGALIFYGTDINSINHVDMAIDSYRIIGAIGGDINTRTPAHALAKNAFVKIRPVNYRPDIVAVIKPNFSSIGLMY